MSDFICSNCGDEVMIEEVFHTKKYENLCIPCYHKVGYSH